MQFYCSLICEMFECQDLVHHSLYEIAVILLLGLNQQLLKYFWALEMGLGLTSSNLIPSAFYLFVVFMLIVSNVLSLFGLYFICLWHSLMSFAHFMSLQVIFCHISYVIFIVLCVLVEIFASLWFFCFFFGFHFGNSASLCWFYYISIPSLISLVILCFF